MDHFCFVAQIIVINKLLLLYWINWIYITYVDSWNKETSIILTNYLLRDE